MSRKKSDLKKFLAFIILALGLVFSFSQNAFARAYDEDTPLPKVTGEEARIVGSWTNSSPEKNKNEFFPCFSFYDNRNGFIQFREDCWDHISFSFDASKSEYSLYTTYGNDHIVFGSARFVPGQSGQPDSLRVEGLFPNSRNDDEFINFKGDLFLMQKERPQKGTVGEWKSESVPREGLGTESDYKMTGGEWARRHGDELRFSSIGRAAEVFYPDGSRSGTINVEWDQERSAFILFVDNDSGGKDEYGWLRLLRDGKNRLARMDIEVKHTDSNDSRVYSAVLEKQNATLGPLPPETMKKLHGKWVSTPDSELRLGLTYSSQYVEHHQISIGKYLGRVGEPLWDNESSTIILMWDEEPPAKGPDGKMYGQGRLCSIQISEDGKTLELTGVYKGKGFRSTLKKK